MRSFSLILILLSFFFQAQFSWGKELPTLSAQIESVYKSYSDGNYEESLGLLNQIELNINTYKRERKNIEGLVFYWKALCLVKLTDFEKAINYFKLAIKEKFDAQDLYYQYGQTLYTSLKLREARSAFKKSAKKGFKKAVSLYYVAYISQELGAYKTAVELYRKLEMLPEDEKKDIVQAARLQIADIYLQHVKKRKDGVALIEKYVIPQYESALDWDKTSDLASDISSQIETIQKRYDLVLFYLRNGRPTARPAYFVKHNYSYSIDDNINLISDNDKKSLNRDQYASAQSTYNFFGRYSFYPNSSFSIVPQLTFNYNKFHSDADEIKARDGLFVTSTLQTTYEHLFNNTAATTFLDLDYTYSMDDADIDSTLEKASSGFGLTLSEQVQIIKNNPSIFRLRYSKTDAINEALSFKSYGLTYEQMFNIKSSILYLTSNYTSNSFDITSEENNSSLSIRADYIFAASFKQISPNIYYSRAQSSFDDAGREETLSTYGINLSRSFGRNWYAFIDYSLNQNVSDETSREFTQNTIRASLDYIY